jgi:hypothetical protein
MKFPIIINNRDRPIERPIIATKGERSRAKPPSFKLGITLLIGISIGSTTQNVPAPAAQAPGETDHEDEEPVPTRRGQSRAADDFFGQGGGRDEDEERKIFRASRFLRRRG